MFQMFYRSFYLSDLGNKQPEGYGREEEGQVHPCRARGGNQQDEATSHSALRGPRPEVTRDSPHPNFLLS